MNKEALVPFYPVGRRQNTEIVPEVKVRLSGITNFLLQHFTVAKSRDDVLFRLAAQDIAKTCPDGFTVQNLNIEFPYVDEESKRPHAPRLPVFVIGCKTNIEKASIDFQRCAEGKRPSHHDEELWLGDLNPAILDFENRERVLKHTTGLPAGIIDKRNSVFIVHTPEVEATITKALRDFRL